MRALLYDIHGNLPALEAVLSDARDQGASSYVLGGDYALFGPWPHEVVAKLRTLNAEWVRGNGERWCFEPASAPDTDLVQAAIEQCRTALGEATVAELGQLSTSLHRDGALVCHGSPLSDVESFLPEADPDDERKLAGATEALVVFGHTHLQFERTDGGRRLVNPGSVGMPFDGDQRAAYALLASDATVRFRRVDYDWQAAAQTVRSRLGSWAETVALRLETARFDP